MSGDMVERAERGLRPDPARPFEVRFETPPGEQAQVDLPTTRLSASRRRALVC